MRELVAAHETPATIEALSAFVSARAAAREAFVIRGGGTRSEYRNLAAEAPAAPVLSLESLAGIDPFEPDEGVLHALAGTPLAAIREHVAEAGWELPLDAPGPASTLGGTIAANATGPRAQAFGRVADAVLGLDVVGADGVATRSGGRVVKNVTGYDLAKLHCGAFGIYGVVTGAWLRLRPAPRRRCVLVGIAPSETDAFDRLRPLVSLQSVRAAVWEAGPGDEPTILFELAGSDAGVAADRERLRSEIALEELEADAGRERVDALRDARAPGGGVGAEVSIRARVPTSALPRLVERAHACRLFVSVDPGRGVLHGRGGVASLEAVLGLRMSAEEAGGFACFERLPEVWKQGLDVFGLDPFEREAMVALRDRFDPDRLLNPGRLTEPA